MGNVGGQQSNATRSYCRRENGPKRIATSTAAAALFLFVAACWLYAEAASAAFEQVGTFGDAPGEVHLNGSRGAAVNATGAGGVPAGSLYTTGRRIDSAGVTRWGSKGELLGHWGGFTGEGIAINQANGLVYVIENKNSGDQIEVFNPTGSEVVATFGERAAPGETVAESPEKIHAVLASSIAVSDSGVVYLADAPGENKGRRVMVFEPKTPGDFSSYVYAGQSRDIAVAKGGSDIALDDEENLYVTTEFEISIEAYAPGSPSTPFCRYETPGRKGGISGMTVNPTNGEVFYFSQKDTNFHQLSACAEGKLVQSGEFSGSPKALKVEGLAFNPTLAWDAFRPAGTLYAPDEELHAGHGQGYIFAAPEVHSPFVEGESVSDVSAASAVLHGLVNPNGSPTRYVFEYITDAAYQANEPTDRFDGASEAPAGGAPIGSGNDAVPVAANVTGLSPATKYHYRLAATNCEPEVQEEICEATGADQVFQTFSEISAPLPDNRAYELVSPAEKHAGEVFPLNPFVYSCKLECKPGTGASERFPMQAAPDGESIVYQGFSFSPTEGSAVLNEYLSKRTNSGWTTVNPTPSQYVADETSGYKVFDPALDAGVLYQTRPPVLAAGAPAGYANLYGQSLVNPADLSPLSLIEPPARPAETVGPLAFHLLFAGASTDLTHVFAAGNDALTEASAFAPKAPTVAASEDNLYEWVGGQLRLVNVLPGNAEASPKATFGSGTTLAKEAGENSDTAADFSHAISEDGSRVFWSSSSGQAYVRINGELTREIPDHVGKFLTAAADGSEVLLSDGLIYGNLEAEVPTNEADLTQGKGGFQGVVGQSDDLSSIYFVDTKSLTPEGEENANAEHAEDGSLNLYSWQEGATSFVAQLETEDNRTWHPSPVRRTAEASPGGQWLAFISRAQLTEFDNSGPCGSKGEIASCPEAYLLNADTGRLLCASCNPSGARPLGTTSLPLIGRSLGSLSQPRYMLDNGRLLFDTRDSLSPLDTNGSVEDVYEYEPQGVGACAEEGGCTSLISAGRESVDSNFLATDPLGKNIFFTTRGRLVSRDRDELLDLYSAREFGGIAGEAEVPDGECKGEACQPPPAPQSPPQPTSSAPQEGNVKSAKACPKGKVRNQKGNCVKKKPKKPKRHHKKAQHKRAANNKRGGAK